MATSPIEYLSFYRANASRVPLVCYAPTMGSTTGLWKDDNPLFYTMPLFIIQIMIVVFTTRLVMFLVKPLRLPRYISEIIGGIILGPSLLGRIPQFSMTIFPLRSLIILDTMANLGLIYYIFIIAVEVEEEAHKRSGIKSVYFAAACLVAPFSIGAISGFIIHDYLHENSNRISFLIFFGLILCVTAFSVLARTIADLKLAGSEVGRITLSSAFLDDIFSWVMLVYSISIEQNGGNEIFALWAVISALLFYYASDLMLKPALCWAAQQVPENEEIDEVYICVTLVGVMVWSFLADAVGTHAVFGAFIFGFFMPQGPLADALVEKVEDFVMGILMPLFFVISGLRTNVFAIHDGSAVAMLVLIVLAAATVKVVGGAVMASMCNMSMHDGISIGLLLNTKGMMEFIILNIGINKMVISTQTFTVLVFTSVVITAGVYPLLNSVVKPVRRLIAYRRRTIAWPNPDAELRLLVCTHNSRQVPALLTLIDIFHPTKRSPLFLYVVHLIELTGRTASALFLINSSSSSPSPHIHGKLKSQSQQIIGSFESYEQHAAGINLNILAAISPYSSMHEDVITAATDRHAAMILIPFHKHLTVDANMRIDHPSIRDLNKNVLDEAPCSVGVLVDRHLGAYRPFHSITVLFFGGPDDREALALASRMAGKPNVHLVVVRFVHVERSPSSVSTSSAGRETPLMKRVLHLDDENERRADDESLMEFKALWGRDIEIYERVVSNAEQTVTAVKEIESEQDLIVVGRGRGFESPVTEGLKLWSECPELGPIGDLLASSDFAGTASVLVLQQGGCGTWRVSTAASEMMSMPSPEVRLYMNKTGPEFRM